MLSRILLSALCFPALTTAFLSFSDQALARDGHAAATELNRIVYAVDGAESNHGKDTSMWRARFDGPQGPMQVSEKAAIDVGGRNRFDIAQNRVIGRAYLDLLYRRYGKQLRSDQLAGKVGLFVIGGENLDAEKLQVWRKFSPNTRLTNEYGPTETVVGCCTYEVGANDPEIGSVPIGRPIANTSLYILDQEKESAAR